MQEATPRPSLVDRDRLIEQHRSYVRALAVEIMRNLLVRVDLNELVAYGHIGLVEAAERYDPRRGVAFSTFSYYRIKGAIYDGLREMGFHTRAAYLRLRAEGLATDLLRTSADDETGDPGTAAMSIDDEIADVETAVGNLIPIFLLSLDSDERVADVTRTAAVAHERLEQDEMVEVLRSLIATLPPEYRRVIEEVYYRDTPMIALAAKMGVTRSWISRLHARGIKMLHRSLVERGLLDET